MWFLRMNRRINLFIPYHKFFIWIGVAWKGVIMLRSWQEGLPVELFVFCKREVFLLFNLNEITKTSWEVKYFNPTSSLGHVKFHSYAILVIGWEGVQLGLIDNIKAWADISTSHQQFQRRNNLGNFLSLCYQVR